jgi:hypothetical protein
VRSYLSLAGFDRQGLSSERGFALGRTITYRDVPVDTWTGKLREAGVPSHVLAHFAAMARLHQQGRYDRMTDDFTRLTGRAPTSMREFVQAHAAEFTRPATTG